MSAVIICDKEQALLHSLKNSIKKPAGIINQFNNPTMKSTKLILAPSLFFLLLLSSCRSTEEYIIPTEQLIQPEAETAAASNDPKDPPKDVPKDYDDWKMILK